MAPPGRRRAPILFLAFLLSTFLFASTSSAASAVLGIDLGTEYIKAALVKPGIPLEIVLTKDSKRKEAAAVAFKSLNDGSLPERAYGSEAVTLAARFPGDVYSNLKRLVGITAQDSPVAKEYAQRHPALSLRSAENRGTVAFQSQAFPKDAEPFLVEELLAMELQNIQANAEALAGKGTHIRDVVITIPPFYTTEERRAVELAANLAGLRVLGLISDGLAVGLNYATSRTFPAVNEGGKPEYHLVYDMGAGSTKATILRFQGRTVKDVGKFNKTIQEVDILGIGWDRSLGGDELNVVLLEHLLTEFVESPKVKKLSWTNGDGDVRVQDRVKQNGRAAAKLWKEAERVRQVLSANSETMSSIESLFEDIDFRVKVTRAKYEELTASYAKRVGGPISRALEAAKLKITDLDSVILHGGAVRTPFVQKQLEEVVGDAGKIRSNVNADEAAVFGAAFKGAGLVPSFRVKEIRTGEAAGYAVSAHWASDGEKERTQTLFLATSKVGAEKQIPFKKLEDFSFTLHQSLPLEEQLGKAALKDTPILRVQTQNLTASVAHLKEKFGCSTSDISTKFAIRLSQKNGQPEVVRGTVSCEADVLVEKKGGVVDDVKGFFGFGSKKGEQEPLQDGPVSDSATENPTSVEEATTATVSFSSGAPSKSSEAKVAEKVATEMKKKTEVVYIEFTTTAEGIPEVPTPKFEQIRERLASLDKSDRNRRLRDETRNNIEAFIYKYRDLLEDASFVKYSSETEREQLRRLLRTTDDWIYGPGADADLDALASKLGELKSVVKPIKGRQREATARPVQITKLKDTLGQVKQMTGAMKGHIDKMQEMSSSLSAEKASSTSQISSSTEAAQSASSSDDFADLDDDKSESTSTTKSTASASPTPDVLMEPVYSPEDLTNIATVEEEVEKWLTTNLKAQESRADHEDPVILTSDIEKKIKQLNDQLLEIVSKNYYTPPNAKKSSSSKSKTKKAKKATKSKSKLSKTTATASKGKATPVVENGADGIPKIKLGDYGEMFGDEEMLELLKEEQKSKSDEKVEKPKETRKDEL